MFDMTHVNTFMDLVAKPEKYQKYLDELNTAQEKWKDTLGAADTLSKANSKLNQAEVILLEAAEKSAKIVAGAEDVKTAAKKVLEEHNTKLRSVEQRERDVATTNKAALELRQTAQELLSEAKQKNRESDERADALAKEQAKCQELQNELNARLEKLKTVMQ
jgi:ribosomal protein L17